MNGLGEELVAIFRQIIRQNDAGFHRPETPATEKRRDIAIGAGCGWTVEPAQIVELVERPDPSRSDGHSGWTASRS